MGEFAEVGAEHYDFTWAGNHTAKKEAQADIFGRTLKFKATEQCKMPILRRISIFREIIFRLSNF